MFKFSNGGSRYREIREPLLKDGKISVEVVGKEDIQEYIDSFEDSCRIENIVARAMNGEPELLDQRKGFYGDFTDYPKTYAEMLDRVIQAQNIFENLPLEIRNRFNNDPVQFIAGMDEKDWFEKAGFAVQKEEVKESEISEP